jgi:hypothetical protein
MDTRLGQVMTTISWGTAGAGESADLVVSQGIRHKFEATGLDTCGMITHWHGAVRLDRTGSAVSSTGDS